ncbi:RNA polymerase sigma factor [Saccharopolyspora sp. NPDC002376]
MSEDLGRRSRAGRHPGSGWSVAAAPSQDEEADLWLVGKARGGDLEAFEVLLRRHQGRIYRIALRMLGNHQDAEDVVQEVFIQLWTALAAFAGTSAFTTWLYRIVVNRCLNHRRSRNPGVFSLDTECPTPVAAGAEDVAMARERVRAVYAAIDDLVPQQRSVLVLCQLEGLSYRETAVVLGISEAAVRSRLSRARRVVLDRMEDWT